MPCRQVGLASWGVVELDRLSQQYGVQKMQGVQVLPPLVNATLCKQEFLLSRYKEVHSGWIYFCRCMDINFLVSIFKSEVF